MAVRRKTAKRAAPAASLVSQLRKSADELKGSHHGQAAEAAATRIEELEQALAQLERLIMGALAKL